MHQEVEEAGEVHLKAEGVREEHLSSLIATVTSILEPSPLEVSYALTASAALGSSSSSCNYTRLKLSKAAQTLI